MCPENEPLKCVLQANRIKLTMLVLFQIPVFAYFALKIITSAEDIVLRCKTESTCKVLVFAYLLCRSATDRIEIEVVASEDVQDTKNQVCTNEVKR